jgi:hypothetical protein
MERKYYIINTNSAQRAATPSSNIFSAVYSGVAVYEMLVRGVSLMRRRIDGYVNVTQLLKIAGVDKGRRTKILDKEIATIPYEKVQGGYGKYQGTWCVCFFFYFHCASSPSIPYLSSKHIYIYI